MAPGDGHPIMGNTVNLQPRPNRSSDTSSQSRSRHETTRHHLFPCRTHRNHGDCGDLPVPAGVGRQQDRPGLWADAPAHHRVVPVDGVAVLGTCRGAYRRRRRPRHQPVPHLGRLMGSTDLGESALGTHPHSRPCRGKDQDGTGLGRSCPGFTRTPHRPGRWPSTHAHRDH